jgi:hypothetical protein
MHSTTFDRNALGKVNFFHLSEEHRDQNLDFLCLRRFPESEAAVAEKPFFS